MIYTFIGSGGKTTAIFQLAQKLLSIRKTVLITTTTHIHTPEAFARTGRALPFYTPSYFSTNADPSDILSHLKKDGICIAAVPSPRDPQKLTALPEDVYTKVCPAADVVLVEGDGSRGLPLKAPSPDEPVIPQNTDEILLFCGMNALGKPLCEVIHRVQNIKKDPGSAFFDRKDFNDPTELPQIENLIRCGYQDRLSRRFPDIPLRLCPTRARSLYERCCASVLVSGLNPSLIKADWFTPAPDLVLLGGGHVSQALYQMACLLDYPVTVIDDRPEFLTVERFPQARRICADFSTLEQILPTKPGALYAVLTRGHQWDLFCVETILKKAPRRGYLGMIGSRRKVAQTLETLKSEGFSDSELNLIHAPIGLDIGAQTPAEIAVSITAQLIQVTRQKRSSSAFPADLQNLEKKERLCGAMALIIQKEGSAPRAEGSIMVRETDGTTTGTVGGGVLEYAILKDLAELSQKPAPETGKNDIQTAVSELFPKRSARLKTYSVSNEESAGLGMICGGKVTVLLATL